MKTNIIIGAVIAAVAIGGLVTGLVIHFTRGPENNGFMVRPGVSDGQTVTLRVGPTFIFADHSVDRNILAEGVSWWNYRQPHQLTYEFNQPLFDAESDRPITERRSVTMSVSELAQEQGGITDIHYDRRTGLILSAIIVINKAHTYDRRTYLGAVKHELGHVLRLDDDPNPGIDLNSIMRLRLNPEGILTPYDQGLLREDPPVMRD